uniref:Uncharacterized protein n=1 Tax=Rhipicephalus microplus TaxID=6941 RepID=A0A6G5AGE2_RHIMP
MVAPYFHMRACSFTRSSTFKSIVVSFAASIDKFLARLFICVKVPTGYRRFTGSSISWLHANLHMSFGFQKSMHVNNASKLKGDDTCALHCSASLKETRQSNENDLLHERAV